MIMNLKAQKEKVKATLEKTIDEYFEAFENGTNQTVFTINEIEQLMVRNSKKINQIMEETTSELTSSIKEVEVPECKKNVLNANRS